MVIYWFAMIWPLHPFFLGVTNDGHFYSAYIRQHYLFNTIQHVNDFYIDSFVHLWFLIVGKVSSILNVTVPKNWTLISATASYGLGILICYQVTNYFYSKSSSFIFVILVTFMLMYHNTFGHRFHEVFAIYAISPVFAGVISGKFLTLNWRKALICSVLSVSAFLSYQPIIILWSFSLLIGCMLIFFYKKQEFVIFVRSNLNTSFIISTASLLIIYIIFLFFNVYVDGGLSVHPQYITKFDLNPNLLWMYTILISFLIYFSFTNHNSDRRKQILYPLSFFLGGFFFYLIISLGTSISTDNHFLFNSNLTKFIWGIEIALPIFLLTSGLISYLEKYYFEILIIFILLILHYNFQRDLKTLSDASDFSSARYEATKATAKILDSEFGQKKFYALMNSEEQFSGYSSKFAQPVPYIIFNGSYLPTISNMQKRIEEISYIIDSEKYEDFRDYLSEKEIEFVSLSRGANNSFSVGGTVANDKRDDDNWSNMVAKSVLIPEDWIEKMAHDIQLDLLYYSKNKIQIKNIKYDISEKLTDEKLLDKFILTDSKNIDNVINIYNIEDNIYLLINNDDKSKRPVLGSKFEECKTDIFKIKPFVRLENIKYEWIRHLNQIQYANFIKCKDQISLDTIDYDETGNIDKLPIISKIPLKIDHGSQVTSGEVKRDYFKYYIKVKLEDSFDIDERIIIHLVPTINNKECKFKHFDQLYRGQTKILLDNKIGSDLENDCKDQYTLRIGKQTENDEVNWLK